MQRICFAAALAVAALPSSIAHAHITIASGPGFANKSGKITFAINHGCTGADTVKIVVDIPAGITGVRAMPSDFGTAKVTRDPNNTDVNTNVTNVTWEKPDALDDDSGYYELTIRAKAPATPFTRAQFDIHQTCRTAAGVETVVDWIQPPGAQSGEPAPLLPIVPPRLPGWNKVVLAAALPNADLPAYFGDALILWRGSEGFSTNANTMAQITATTGVSVLTADLAIGDENLGEVLMRGVLALALALAACGDNKQPPRPGDDAAVPDAAVVAPDAPAKGSCLDQPDVLQRPSATLPCDLLPPSVAR